MPIRGDEVLDSIGFEQDRAVDEPSLFGASEVPERVAVPKRHMGRVLERTSAIGTGSEGQEPAVKGEAAVSFLHRVDRVAKVFEGVVGTEDSDLAVAEGPALVEVGCDVGAVEVNGIVAGGGVEAAAEVDHSQGVQVAPAFNERVDVLVVDAERLGLDERVLVAATGVGRVDIVDVQAAIDVLHAAVDVGSAQQVVVVENRP